MPPVTLYQCWIPWRLSALITVLERSPPAQSTALGRPGGTRSRRATDSIIGRWMAPSMWPSSHSKGSRTSMTARSRPSSSHSARSCTVICGTDSTGNPPLFHSIIPHWRNPATSSTPTRESACTAGWSSDGRCARISSGTPPGPAHATRSANCGLSIQTLSAPGMWLSPYVPGSRRSTTHSPRWTASHASRAVYGRGFAAWSGISPLFLPTILSNWGGFGGRSRMMKSTNAARSRSCNAALKRRSKPIVEPAVAEPLMIEGEASGPVSEDRRVRRGGEVAVARDVVGVGVRLDDVRDLQALAPRQSQIFVDTVAARIDDDGLAGLAAADQVREAPGLLVQDLLEDHPGPILCQDLSASRPSPSRSWLPW